MAISQLINFLIGARRLSKFDPATEFPNQPVTSGEIKSHRLLLVGGKIGCFIGVIFGVWAGYETYIHPENPKDGPSIGMSFVAMPLLMIVAGILGGLSWTGLFLPSSFFRGPIAQHWLKFVGTKSVFSTRVLAAIVGLIVLGLYVFLAICVRLGKV